MADLPTTGCGSPDSPARQLKVKDELLKAGSVSDSAEAELRREMRLISALTGMSLVEIEDLDSVHFQRLKMRLIR